MIPESKSLQVSNSNNLKAKYKNHGLEDEMSDLSSRCKITQIRASRMTEGIKKQDFKLPCSIMDLDALWHVPTVIAPAGDSGWRVLN